MKQLLFLTSTFLVILIVFVTIIPAFPTFAQTSSLTASSSTATISPTPTSSDAQTQQNLKDRINKVIQQRKDQVKGAMDKLALKERGFVAQVTRVTNSTVTMQNKNGSQILAIDSSVVIVKENKKASLDDIAVDDWVIAMGYEDPSTTQGFILKRLLVSSESPFPSHSDTMVGTMQSISHTQCSLLPRGAQDPMTFVLNKDTTYEDFNGKPLKQGDIQTDNLYLIISLPGKDQHTATIIHSLVQPTPSPTSSPNATSSSTPSTNNGN